MSSYFVNGAKNELKTEVTLKKEQQRIISLSEVSLHDSFDDCWIVLFNRVYNLTSFMMSHPGGAEVLLENAGRDATLAFQDAGHTSVSLSMMDDYRIGVLPEHEHFNIIFNPAQGSYQLKT
ncbi:hypothetical protein O3M35_004734 [Rhynocoris fuscipes]|uniref:Cytochrome b5 heme-binding domain-containing protein n=1 Tax=Rhynocoris fuscipes TaxID=488301 RepID=A0AAW1DJF7_9HEMI